MSSLKQRQEARLYPLNSMEGLQAWLMRQPRDQRYVWENCDHCLVGCYLSARNVCPEKLASAYSNFVIAVGSAAVDTIAWSKPHTYGAALQRLERSLGVLR